MATELGGLKQTWVVILKIAGGTFETGFPCQLLVSPQDKPRETFTGRLPASLELRDCYDRWKRLYDSLGQANLITLPPQTIVVSHFDECEQAAQQLKRALNAWLNTESFRNMERQWLQTMPSRVRTLHFFVQTDEPCLKRLPWQVWDLLEQHYPDTEVMLSTEYKPSQVVLRSPLRILAVEGNTTGTTARLNLGPLTTHPNLQIETLQQPAKKVFEDTLWDESWDILFFMGHSRSHEFEPNSGEKISVNELHHALENAVKNGLKLAIFNSCDGVDIAAKLADLNIPYTIVMRHPIPDKMAELFLETFLKQFAQGKSIHESVHTARRRLKDKNSSFPCADWLPVIYQNPGAPDMRYVKPRARSPWLNRSVASFLLLACLGLVLAFSWRDRQIQADYDQQNKA
jgi:branched-chain amino acid transport system substrate-binding protein